jgi:succinate dehydrogenase / fumarate reductase cytochrome b subunit
LVQAEKRDHREGVRGWLNPTRYGWHRVSFWLQRLTGLGLLAYFVAHIIETSSLAQGKFAWDKMLELTQTTEGHIILIVVIGMCVFHAANGVRLYIAHGGRGVGAPGRPDYPYIPTSLSLKMRACIWVSMALAALAMMYGASVLFGE